MEKFVNIMESEEETLRLDIKTDTKVIENQALWAGLSPGMRIADLGFGSGKTTRCLHRLAQPGGKTVGVDIEKNRIEFAEANYSGEGIEYHCRDLREPISDLGLFDFVWIRFVLEYQGSRIVDILNTIDTILKPGGVVCLIDLDYNCLTHYGIPERLESALLGTISRLADNADFDPFVGRKLYSCLYDLHYQEIAVDVSPHHLIYGDLGEVDAFNWIKKIEVAAKNSGYDFAEYGGDYDAFRKEFKESFANPRRFTYTPVICCRGKKPA
jgi:SAM-dependent methyltransferase